MTDHTAIAGPRRRARTWAHPWVMGLLLFFCVLSGYALTFNVDKPTHNADWYIRYQVTCSIVERNAFYIRPYRDDGRDGVGVDGHKYSQYTLGQTTALIPFYLLGRVLAGLPQTNCDAVVPPTIVFLTAKMLDPVLGALLCVLFFFTVRLLRYSSRVALALSLIFAFGTALWPDVLSNLEHTMESLFLLTAAYAALRYTLARRKTRLWLLVMGLAAGLVFVTRVAGLIAPPIFAIYLVLLHRHWRPQGWRRPFLRDLILYAIGVLPSILINGVFDAIRFGAPWKTGPKPDQSFGYPPWFGIPNLLISPGKGIIWYVPVLLLLPFVFMLFWRRYPLPARLFVLISGIYLFFYANVNYWHGDPAWGPRYLYAILPYLLLPLSELLQRWRAIKWPLRTLAVTVMALSFLIQFSSATVSYWRHWHYIYAYHYDQVENHAWGQNLNYWWQPDQSPLVISLSGIATITQKYLSHAPLLEHPGRHLSDPDETCFFKIFNQAGICLTDLDELNNGANWNTFTVWWAHSYSWWSQDTVDHIALVLLFLFLGTGGTAMVLVTLPARRARPEDEVASPLMRRLILAQDLNGHLGNGHSRNGHSSGSPASFSPHDFEFLGGDGERQPLAAHSSAGTLVAEQPVRVLPLASSTLQPVKRAAGPGPLLAAVALGALLYGGIVGVAALTAPKTTPALYSTASSGEVVHDGSWTYQVLKSSIVRAFPGDLQPPPFAHQYLVVTLQIHNMFGREARLRPEFFEATDAQGLNYPLVTSLLRPVAQLYRMTPFGRNVPAHAVIDGVLVFQIRDGVQHLKLLGPGITLTSL